MKTINYQDKRKHEEAIIRVTALLSFQTYFIEKSYVSSK